jgi:AcrR family transcriptional regulator
MAVPERLTRAEKRAQTRQRLLDGAAEVIRRRGYGAASVEAIASEAGFTRGAFYSNFDTKEQLFVELLQDRVYRNYRRLLEELPESGGATPLERLRWGAQQLAERQRNDDDRWLFELWLELLAHSAREPELARLAAGFWTGTRATLTTMIEATAAELGTELPVPAKHLAIAQTALDIGLAVQHLVDPEEVPLDLYPELFVLLFGRYAEPPDDG